MSLLVIFEVRLLCECFEAYIALVRPFGIMHPQMHFHIEFESKPFLADIALVRFLPGVQELMPL
jgi:hypothetical protein